MSDAILSMKAVQTHIGAYHILHGVDLQVPRGKVTVLLGRNGAGKSTTLRTIMGIYNASSGSVTLDGTDITKFSTPMVAREGVGYVPEEMGVFSLLTVRENMEIAARSGPMNPDRLAWIFKIFPAMEKFWEYPAGSLSGGQKQMLSVSRAIIEPRKLLLIDEPTKGLAPSIINQMKGALLELKKAGETILLVEQNFDFASALGDHAAVMDNGKVIHAGPMRQIIEDQELQTRLLGLSLDAHQGLE